MEKIYIDNIVLCESLEDFLDWVSGRKIQDSGNSSHPWYGRENRDMEKFFKIKL